MGKPWNGNAAVTMCSTEYRLNSSILVIVSMTDGTADSGELDLSGIDDSEINLVCRTSSWILTQ